MLDKRSMTVYVLGLAMSYLSDSVTDIPDLSHKQRLLMMMIYIIAAAVFLLLTEDLRLYWSNDKDTKNRTTFSTLVINMLKI